MNITYADDIRFHREMRGNYNLEDVVKYITEYFRPDEIYTDSELRACFEDNNE